MAVPESESLLQRIDPTHLRAGDRILILAALATREADAPVRPRDLAELAIAVHWPSQYVNQTVIRLLAGGLLRRLGTGQYLPTDAGMERVRVLGDDGSVPELRTLFSGEQGEADAGVSPLESQFDARKFQPEVARHSRSLFASGHPSEAIRIAVQHYNNRIKRLVGREDLDGQPLMSVTFGEQPLLALSDRETESEINEHAGLRFLSMGAIQALRNPRAHETDVLENYDNEPTEVLEWLGFVSALHRLIDSAELVAPVEGE